MEKELQRIDIEFEGIEYIVSVPNQKEKKQVLKNVSGHFRSGQITAIMGPSGAGKSSLLNILTGFTTQGVKGELSLDKFNAAGKSNRKFCSYILQDDNLFPWFTVEETMMTAANLKIGCDSRTEDEKQVWIDHLLNLLHLTFAKNTKCSNLSGGQRKRLSIALELLDNPPILFLDEPTTGLDSSSSAYTIRLLHELAREGRTIVCTIHQPSATVYELFDHIYVLAEGQCIYQGSADNTVPYLSSLGLNCPKYHSAADYLLEVANGECGDYIAQLAAASADNKWRLSRIFITDRFHNSLERLDDEQSNCEKRISFFEQSESSSGKFSSRSTDFHKPSEFARLQVLIKRCNIQLYRDWTVTHLKLFLHIATAILMGLFFGDSGDNATKSISNIGLMLINLVYLWYTTMMPGVLRFPSEVAILKKETFNNWYKLRTYYLASIITGTPVHIMFATVYASIVFYMTDQPLEFERYFGFVVALILISIVADGFGIFLGTLVNPINGTFIGAICTCFMLVFSGFLVLFNHMPRVMYYLTFTSCHRYGLENQVLSLYGYDRSDIGCPADALYCHYRKPDTIIRDLGMNSQNYQFNLMMMFGQLFLFKTLSFFTLRRRLKCG